MVFGGQAVFGSSSRSGDQIHLTHVQRKELVLTYVNWKTSVSTRWTSGAVLGNITLYSPSKKANRRRNRHRSRFVG